MEIPDTFNGQSTCSYVLTTTFKCLNVIGDKKVFASSLDPAQLDPVCDGPTDGQTYPLIEMRGRIEKDSLILLSPVGLDDNISGVGIIGYDIECAAMHLS